jgi:hypothetical protein
MEKIGGLIAGYCLEKWFLDTFTEEECGYMNDRYQPMGSQLNTLIKGKGIKSSLPVTTFLNGLITFFRSKNDATIADRLYVKLQELGRENPITGPGYYNGRHYTTYVREVEEFKRNEKNQELEALLLELVQATEDADEENKWGVAPYYYGELAILYRKQKEYPKEVAILERFAKQKHAPGVMPARLLERLEKAKELGKIT